MRRRGNVTSGIKRLKGIWTALLEVDNAKKHVNK